MRDNTTENNMTRKIPVLVDEDIYYLLHEQASAQDHCLSDVIRRLVEREGPEHQRRQSIQEVTTRPMRRVG